MPIPLVICFSFKRHNHLWGMGGVGVLMVLAVGACGGDNGSGSPTVSGPPATLSAWGLFEAPLSALKPAVGVVPYEPVSPLFSDHADKHRFIRLPPGTRVGYRAAGEFDWPDGAIIIKHFGFLADLRNPASAARPIETRILERREGVWKPHLYRWNEAGTEAYPLAVGAVASVSYIDRAGQARREDYNIPNINQCAICHSQNKVMDTLGVHAAQLDFTVTHAGTATNQLDWLHTQGIFAEAPTTRPMIPLVNPRDATRPLEIRARSYLEANCGHCHRPNAEGGPSGLWLQAHRPLDATAGVCKPPIAAGRGSGSLKYDIVPGRPDDSILVFRMASTDAGIRMPEIPNRLVDDEGLDIVRRWIAEMNGPSCPGL